MSNAIILANGSFPRRLEALQAMQEIPLLICCDGAYNRLVESRIFANAERIPEVHVVGDGDSLSDAIRNHPPFPTVFVNDYKDQETNDLTKTVKYAVSKGVDRIVILGATGLREDHALANISLLADYSSMLTLAGKPLGVRMYSDYGYFTPLTSSREIHSFAGQQVSLFLLEGDVRLSVEGLKYPVENRTFRHWWEGSLNEALGDSFTVNLSGSGTLLVYQTHDAKG